LRLAAKGVARFPFPPHGLVPAMHHERGNGVPGKVGGAVLARNGKLILSWGGDDTVRLWDAATGRELIPAMRHEQRDGSMWSIGGAVFSRDEGRILSWGDEGTVRLWEAATGRELVPAMRHERGSGIGIRWDTATGERYELELGGRESITGAVFSRDESHILSWGGDDTVRLWEAVTGRALIPAMHHEGSVQGAAFSRDDSRILSWGGDGAVRLWDAATGRELVPAMHHERGLGGVQGAAFSRDESRILSWGSEGSIQDGAVRLWDAATGSELIPAMHHGGSVQGAAFSRDDGRILSWGRDGTIRPVAASHSRTMPSSPQLRMRLSSPLNAAPPSLPLPPSIEPADHHQGLMHPDSAEVCKQLRASYPLVGAIRPPQYVAMELQVVASGE
jgi:WD40 repeat protein